MLNLNNIYVVKMHASRQRIFMLLIFTGILDDIQFYCFQPAGHQLPDI